VFPSRNHVTDLIPWDFHVPMLPDFRGLKVYKMRIVLIPFYCSDAIGCRDITFHERFTQCVELEL